MIILKIIRGEKMTTYKNSFYTPKNPISRKEFSTEVTPIEYKNYLIFHRINPNSPIKDGAHVFDVVINGICIGQYAGLNGAKHFIDNIGRG